jgi:hypothetical protein
MKLENSDPIIKASEKVTNQTSKKRFIQPRHKELGYFKEIKEFAFLHFI